MQAYATGYVLIYVTTLKLHWPGLIIQFWHEPHRKHSIIVICLFAGHSLTTATSSRSTILAFSHYVTIQ
jgi:hypothetical protein